MAVQNAPGQQFTLRYDPQKGKAVRESAKSAKNGPATFDGSFLFAGIEDQYFTATFLPSSDAPFQTTTFDDVVPTPFNASEEAYPGVAVGGAARRRGEPPPTRLVEQGGLPLPRQLLVVVDRHPELLHRCLRDGRATRFLPYGARRSAR
jgi:hypothetical protein